jgi:TRAP-type mannitol/chloroaromatic compound transport system permease large subunit
MHPPFGMALVYLRRVAPPEVKTTDIHVGIIPFVAIPLICLVVPWWWPWLARWLSGMLNGVI